MAEVAGAKVRSPLAETTNRINSPFPPFEQQPHGKPRPDHAEARHAHAHTHAHAQAQTRRTVPNPMAENSRPQLHMASPLTPPQS